MAYKSLQRGLKVLGHIAEAEKGLSVTEVSQLIDTDKSAASRILSALNQVGFVRRKDSRGPYTLGTRVMEMGLRALGGMTASEEARPFVENLSRRVQTTGYFAVRTNIRVMPVVFFTPPNVVQVHSCIGTTFSLHTSAAGKNYLAHMSIEERKELLHHTGLPSSTDKSITESTQLEKELVKIRQQGYAVDNEETERGVKCVSAPVFDIHGNIAGTLGITGLSSLLTKTRIRSIASSIKEEAHRLSRHLGYQNGLSNDKNGKKYGARE